MLRKYCLALLFLSTLFSCSHEKPEIRTVSEHTRDGNYLIKWETFPPIEGKVSIFASASPDAFDLNQKPVAEVEIGTGYTLVPPLPERARTYFKLVFNDKYSSITSERTIAMDRVFNFRDLGGYHNTKNGQLKWGKVYRSSSITLASEKDQKIIHQLGIKSVIDLRGEYFAQTDELKFPIDNYYNIPMRGNRYNVFFDQILAGKLQRADILKHLQEVFYFFAENNSDFLIDIFNVLLEENNYPLVIYCSLGNDRSAMAAAIILAALDVNENTIISDYLLSNELIDYHALAKNASQFDPKVQESLTALFSVHRETIVYTFEKIKGEYGSVNSYLENELQLTNDKRNKLKELLLYP